MWNCLTFKQAQGSKCQREFESQLKELCWLFVGNQGASVVGRRPTRDTTQSTRDSVELILILYQEGKSLGMTLK